MRRRTRASQSDEEDDAKLPDESDSGGEDGFHSGDEVIGEQLVEETFGETNEENNLQNKIAEDPALVPKAGRFFMHDDRSFGQNRRLVLTNQLNISQDGR